MSAENCNVRGPEAGRRGIGAVRLRLTAPYADSFALGACRTWVPVASHVGERGQFFMISRRIVVLCNEKSGKNAPLFPPAQ